MLWCRQRGQRQGRQLHFLAEETMQVAQSPAATGTWRGTYLRAEGASFTNMTKPKDSPRLHFYSHLAPERLQVRAPRQSPGRNWENSSLRMLRKKKEEAQTVKGDYPLKKKKKPEAPLLPYKPPRWWTAPPHTLMLPPPPVSTPAPRCSDNAPGIWEKG